MHGYVQSTRWLTPTMVRVVLGGGDLHRFAPVEATDAYVNLAFAPEGADYGGAFDPAVVAATRPRHEQPARRRFTVRRWDAGAGELTVDFVVHGDVGVAGRWAARAVPGDVLVLEGPAGGYRPDPGAAVHLMLGDESALPGVAAALEVLPAGARAVVRLVVDGPGHELALGTRADLDLAWLHRTGSPEDVDLLLRATRDLVLPPGPVHAFVHGEAEEVRGVRRHLLVDRGLPRAGMSCSPYWRRTMTDEAWRRVKADFLAAMDRDVVAQGA
ncbi:siderophore-interacting protein [Vallicoccus soli]|uniref:Siderophore-interacting protein n=1 Tax=Vallicoccus soli TaxID=2339232 RepID=A0A3A3ZHT5_9ACTN|nr:siderophore-interacting protein [Vallicoccus soli]RJK94866.1 siderophore-interacting protein [Vallicoccus soli]